MIHQIDENILLSTSQFIKQKEYWLTKLSADIRKTEIVFGSPKKGSNKNHKGKCTSVFPAPLSQQLIDMGKSSDLSIYIILLTALKSLIYRYTQTNDIILLSPLNKKKISSETMNDRLMIRDQVEPFMTIKKLILGIRKTLQEAYANQDYPFENLYHDIFEREFDPDDNVVPGIVCALNTLHDQDNINGIGSQLTFLFLREEAGITLQLIYDTRLYQEDQIVQLTNHYINILKNSMADINAQCANTPLLSSEEKRHLIFEFNDNRNDFPRQQSIYELFVEQVEKAPENIAVTGAGETGEWNPDGPAELSYRELNDNVNRLAIVLASHGIKEDQTVGIMLKRSSKMIESILATWKVGGAYIPIDSQSPIIRAASILNDAAAVALITHSDEIVSLMADRYNGAVIQLDQEFDSTQAQEVKRPNPTPRNMNSLSYVIYTSGSTGKPKGVMVEHIGMMNHISAKIRDLQVTVESIIAQNASHTFDISVWQFFTALCQGGKTIVYPNELILETDRFINQVMEDQITILEVVPSYLRVMLESLDLNPRSFSALQYLMVTGEEIKKQLVEKWFEKYPRIQMVNAYGPTEAADDITHYIMATAPETAIVPIGKSLYNFNIYIVDANMNLCPPGMKGEICVSGVGVGRGYLNNPQLTKNVFLLDPFIIPKESQRRMYKTGDIGRWLPDGSIEFFGRIDHQVKIRGFRIELGEIETQLMNHKDVNEAVVIDKEDEFQVKFLCAYIVAHHTIDISAIKEFMAQRLPHYMVPAYFIQLDKIPLTPNGKIDRKALPQIETDANNEYLPPRNPIEQMLAEIIGGVLGRTGKKPVGIDENFFEIGGDSIRAIQITSRMYKAGYKIKIGDIFRNPAIIELATAVTELEQIADQSVITGNFPLTPIQAEFFKKITTSFHHFNQAVILFSPEGFPDEMIKQVFEKIQKHHDALRITFNRVDGHIIQTNHGLDIPLSLDLFDFRGIEDKHKVDEALNLEVNKIQAGIDLEKGPLMKLGLFHLVDGDRLLIVVHHLIMDGVSWRILFEDIETLYQQHKNGETLALSPKTDAFKTWSQQLKEYADSQPFLEEISYWKQLELSSVPRLPKDFDGTENLTKHSKHLSFNLDQQETQQLLRQVNDAFGTDINDLLLTALGLAIKETYMYDLVCIAFEGHGREEILDDVNINRTIGWFTSVYPVVLDMSHTPNLARQLIEVKETLRRIPNGGIGYGILKYLTKEEHKNGMAMEIEPQIGFNYLGQFDADLEQTSFVMAPDSSGETKDKNAQRELELEFDGIIATGRLSMTLTYSEKQFEPQKLQQLMDSYKIQLLKLISFCLQQEGQEITPSDLTYGDLQVEFLEKLKDRFPIKDIYPLSAMQESLLFHALMGKDSATYFEQFSYRLHGHLSIPLVERSVNLLMERYDILRTTFIYEGVIRPLQVVLKERQIEFFYQDLSQIHGPHAQPKQLENHIKEFKIKDRQRGFDITNDVLVRVVVLQVAESQYEFIWDFHHILMDGWCVGIIVTEFTEIYSSFLQNKTSRLPPVKPYRSYIQWLENRDKKASSDYWTRYLEGYEAAASLPGKNTDTNTPYENRQVSIVIPVDKTKNIQQLASKNQVTLNTLIQSIWGVLLSRYNATRDVVFAAVVSGRPAEIEGVETMVGLFINTIPVRVQYQKETTFKQLLQLIQEEAGNSQPHHHYPLANIQSLSVLKQHLLDHVIVFENLPLANQLDGIADNREKQAKNKPTFSISNMGIFEQSNYDFGLMVVPGITLKMHLMYNGNVYKDEFIESIAQHLQLVIDQLLLNESQSIAEISLLTKEEQQRILFQFNDTQTDYPADKTIPQLFEQQVQKRPDNIAIVGAGSLKQWHSQDVIQLTYCALYEQANHFADLLISEGIGPGTIVAIMGHRSLETIIGILATMKAGGAYLPIDPFYPQERIDFMLQDSCARILLDGLEMKSLADPAPFSQPVLTPQTLNTLDFAYIIYTSGSTGRPKGVLIRHNSFVNMSLAQVIGFDVTPSDKVMQFASFSFDASVSEIFMALFAGATLVVLPKEQLIAAHQFIWQMGRFGITIITLPPTYLNQLNKTEFKTLPLKTLITAGEAPKAEDVHSYSQVTHYFNAYGPTETSVCASFNKFPAGHNGIMTIGKPIANTRIYILDNDFELQPVGILGEICVAGTGLAEGYLNKPELTSEKFSYCKLTNDSPPTLMYKTGDIGRWLADGNIELMGRMDRQIKIRGIRVELGEIEREFLSHPGIADGAIIAVAKNDDKQLIAFYIRKKQVQLSSSLADGNTENPLRQPTTSITQKDLKEYLSSKLPEYMVPAIFVEIQEMPLTSNGKVDQKVLAKLSQESRELTSNEYYEPPQNEIETKLVQIWQEVLDLKKIGVHENFFDLGGNSLLSIKIIGKVRDVFEKDVPIETIFQYMTVRSFVQYLQQGETPKDFIKKDRAVKQLEGKNRMKQTMKKMRKKSQN
jgi:amino acid adenylation domain-containing protein/non-ribosomal peptide synthase protein (TIGR01720 family)